MRRVLSLGLILFAVATAAGCVKGDSRLVLHADGSVDVVHKAAVSDKAIRELMGDLFKDPDLKPDPIYDKKMIATALERAKALGVKVKVFEVEIKDGWQRIHVEARCRDLLSAGFLAKAADMDVKYVLVRNADGSYTFSERVNHLMDPTALIAARPTEKDRKEALEKLKGLRSVTTIVVPGDVKATTASEREGRTVKWVLDASDPDFWKKAEGQVGKATSVTFAAKGLKLKEFGRHRYILSHVDVELKSDGRLIVIEKKAMHLQMIEEMHGFGHILGAKKRIADAWFDEKQLRASTQKLLNEGDRILEVKCTEEKGWKRSLVRTSYPDLGAARKGALNRTATLKKNDDGSYAFSIQSGNRFLAQQMTGKTGKLMLKQHMKLCDFMRNSYTARVPGKVLKTNAHQTTDGAQSWAYLPADPELEGKVLKRLTEGMSVTFKGAGLKLKEFTRPDSTVHGIFGFRDGAGRRVKPKEPAEKKEEKPDE